MLIEKARKQVQKRMNCGKKNNLEKLAETQTAGKS